MKKFLLLAIVLGLAPVVMAQTPSTVAGECKLTVLKSPAIRGLRLGITVDQALAVLPGAEYDGEIRRQLSNVRFGQSAARISPGRYAGQDKFAGVNSVELTFLDGQLSAFVVYYQGPEWKSVNQFLDKVSESLRLPGSESWEPKMAMDSGSKRLKCDGFEVNVFVSGNADNRITLLIPGTSAIVQAREEAPKEQARRAFKP